jgi:hypothetical protein
MLRKIVVAAALTAAFVVPAFAATTYYVEQSVKTKTCSVTTHKPDGKAFTMVGTDTYKTKADATKAMDAAAECKKA